MQNPSAQVKTRSLGLGRMCQKLHLTPISRKWKHQGLDREMHQDPDRDRYISDEEGTVIDNAADEFELIAVSKCPTRLLPHSMVVYTNLEPSLQEATPLKKIWCVKLMDDAHAPGIVSGQLNVIKTYLQAGYRLSDLLRVL